MKKRPDSKAGRSQAADLLIRRLLRTPKTRSGLIAAVTTAKVSRNFVYGWLAARRQDGTLTVLKVAGQQVMYQITNNVVEKAREGEFPSWLEPRSLPTARDRIVFVAGHKAKPKKDQ